MPTAATVLLWYVVSLKNFYYFFFFYNSPSRKRWEIDSLSTPTTIYRSNFKMNFYNIDKIFDLKFFKIVLLVTVSKDFR